MSKDPLGLDLHVSSMLWEWGDYIPQHLPLKVELKLSHNK